MMAGSLDDNPPRLFEQNLEYIVHGYPGQARIFVSRDSVMSHDMIADQLRSLANYIEGIDGDCDCHGAT